MAGAREVIDAIQRSLSAYEIMRELKMKPSRLRRILTGRQFRLHLEMESLLTQIIMRHRTSTAAGPVLYNLTTMTDSNDLTTARKSCIVMLQQLMAQFPNGRNRRAPLGGQCETDLSLEELACGQARNTPGPCQPGENSSYWETVRSFLAALAKDDQQPSQIGQIPDGDGNKACVSG